MTSRKKLHCIIIITSALLGAFEHNQRITGIPRCVGIGVHDWFPVNFAAVAMVMAVLSAMMKI